MIKREILFRTSVNRVASQKFVHHWRFSVAAYEIYTSTYCRTLPPQCHHLANVTLPSPWPLPRHPYPVHLQPRTNPQPTNPSRSPSIPKPFSPFPASSS